ncbi:nitrate regulatory gene2 protein-like [Neltuma alba]|uniref:nitrate regulatory gene2 protein-like n=1 Tax=Neltuma alba TaxID=207710 RepID=UPI0010A373F5|nr:nitrate regulatory gene2 protein-like [Prosopis alba]
MGCTASNLNDLPAVTLCRQRRAFLDETIRHSYALSAAHLSYINSLHSIALSLQQLHHFPAPSLPPHNDDRDLPLPPPHHPFTYTPQSYPRGHLSSPSAAFMKHTAPPSQVYEQMPFSPPAFHMADYSSFYSSSFSHTNSNPSHYFGYQNFGVGSGGYYCSTPPFGPDLSAVASSSQPPPGIYSPWHFHNSYYDEDGHHSELTTSQDLKQIREDDGIPDLEDDDYEYELVEPVQEDQSDADDGAGTHSKSSKDNQAELTEASLHQTMPLGSMENDGVEAVEHEVHADDEMSGERGGPPNAFELASEIEAQFRRASESGTEIAKILEVGTLPYYRKHVAYQAFSKMLKLVALPLSLMVSQPSISKVYKIGPGSLELDGDLLTRSRNLSSTLQKLHLWEKKLYKEVKAEEKIRVLHDRKCRLLRRLDDRGADFHKVDAAQTLIKKLSTKIRMVIQVVDLISVKIDKIRDEELWPQLNELIQGLGRMWKAMLECHQIQCEAMREAGILAWMGSKKKNGIADEATKQLEQEVINWTLQFSSWMGAQKRYVRALNNWLLKCLPYESEETAEGVGGFSPGRMGAPRVFVICNRWSQAMERISEKEVVERMYVFGRGVLQIWEQERLEIMLEREVGRNVVQGDEQKLQKQIQEVKQKMVAAFREVNDSLSHSEDIICDEEDKGGSTSLQAGLRQIFEAMESFAGISARLYEELLQTSDVEERASAEHMHAC